MPGTVRSKPTPRPDGSIISGSRLWKTSKQEGQSRSMKSLTTPSFWRSYRSLPAEIQAEADKTYRLWKENPRHPSLHFERKGDYWSVRITRGWRALGRIHDGTLYWFWIGPHDEYERILGR